MTVDPASAARAQLSLEKDAKLAVKRDKYINERLRQIKMWNAIGWLFLVLLGVAAFWIYQQKPLYLDPQLLASQIAIGKLPSNEMAQLAALGSILFWGMITLLAGFIVQIYVAMYSERKLIRLFATLHEVDLARHQPADQPTDAEHHDTPTLSDEERLS